MKNNYKKTVKRKIPKKKQPITNKHKEVIEEENRIEEIEEDVIIPEEKEEKEEIIEEEENLDSLDKDILTKEDKKKLRAKKAASKKEKKEKLAEIKKTEEYKAQKRSRIKGAEKKLVKKIVAIVAIASMLLASCGTLIFYILNMD